MNNENMTKEKLRKLLQSDREPIISKKFVHTPKEYDDFMDWIKETHPDIRLAKFQQSVIRDAFNVVYSCGRGFGKSFLLKLWKEFDERNKHEK